VCLAKEQRWSEAVHFGRKACSASEADSILLCGDELRLSAGCIDARLSSACLMFAIMLRDSGSSRESRSESEAVFGKILAAGKQVFAKAEEAGVSVPPAAARTACR
jgi:hypothetical protein